LNINVQTLDEIKKVSSKYRSIQKICLFGSRAREANNKHSDIDIAVFADNFEDFYEFKGDIDFIVNTLLKIDITLVSKDTEEYLLKQIRADGVVIYEKS
jgi:predicted nucleotidyltransferase